jgi:hypothetical protein
VREDVRPTCVGNTCDSGLDLFDERIAGGRQWRLKYASDVIEMGNLRRLDVQQSKDGDWVVLTTSEKDIIQKLGSETQNKLSRVGEEFMLQTEVVEIEITAQEWRRKWPQPRNIETEFADQKCSVSTLPSVLSLVGQEGCADTNPVFILLTRVAEDDESFSRTVLWASPRVDRGHVLLAVADFDGDGLFEIVVATRRWCEHKGQLLVFAQDPHGEGSD